MALHSNIELARLSWAHQKIKPLVEPKERAQKYRALTRKLPSMIQTNGILNTLLFLKGKAKIKGNNRNEYQILLDQLLEWSRQTVSLIEPLQQDDWIETVLNKKSNEVRQINREYLILSGYLKRVAEALIEEKETITQTPPTQHA